MLYLHGRCCRCLGRQSLHQLRQRRVAASGGAAGLAARSQLSALLGRRAGAGAAAAGGCLQLRWRLPPLLRQAAPRAGNGLQPKGRFAGHAGHLAQVGVGHQGEGELVLHHLLWQGGRGVQGWELGGGRACYGVKSK